jgi:hypothetical protein
MQNAWYEEREIGIKLLSGGIPSKRKLPNSQVYCLTI